MRSSTGREEVLNFFEQLGLNEANMFESSSIPIAYNTGQSICTRSESMMTKDN